MQSFLWSSARYGVFGAIGNRLRAARVLVFTLLAAFSVAVSVSATAAAAQTVRITVLGDSLTQGYGLPPEQGLVPQLERWLRARGHDVELINAGVSGDTTAGGLSRLDWTLADRPEAMIVALGGNDLLRGLDPALSRANLAAILERLRAEGIPALLVGMPAPANYGPDYQAAFAAMYPELAEAYGALLVEDMLAPLRARLAAGDAPGTVFQGDMIHPNADGVAQVVAHLGPQVEALIARVRAESGAG